MSKMRSALCSPDGSIRLACLRMLLQNFDSFEYSLVYFKFYYKMVVCVFFSL